MAWRRGRCPSQAVGFLGLPELLNDAPEARETFAPGLGLPGSALGRSSVPNAPRPSRELRALFVERNGVTSQTPRGSHWPLQG